MGTKERLDEQTMALRAAKELNDGDYVNLGIGIGSLISAVIADDKKIIFQTENGVLGDGGVIIDAGERDFDITNASAHPIDIMPGGCFFDVVESFAMIRGRHLDASVLGALQVSETGDLANWTRPGEDIPSIGGAMDLAISANKVIVTMTHTTKNDKPRILKKCSFPLTAQNCVNLIITDLAVIEVVKNKGLVLKEIAPGWTADEIQALTEAKLIIDKDIKDIEL